MKHQTEKLSKKNSLCKLRADSIYSTSPTLKQIEETLAGLWDIAYAEAWNDCISFNKKLRDQTERILAKDFGKLRDQIEDKIHQNK